MPDIFDRMMDKVVPVPEAGCWLFTGSVDGGGYGQVSTSRGKAPAKAHRISFEALRGSIPKGMHVLHKCDTPRCVNPDHLFVGTQRDNAIDCSRKGRRNPVSFENLRPGAPGFHGAGPVSKGKSYGPRN